MSPPAPSKKRKASEISRSTPKTAPKKSKKQSLLWPDSQPPFRADCLPLGAAVAAQKYSGCDYHEATADLTEGFVHPYSIITKPGRDKAWAEEKEYRNANILGLVVSVGNIIFIKVANDEDLKPLPEDPTAEEQLAYDQQYAVAQILEIRAANAANVWVLVAYFYWPQELEPPSLRNLPRWEDGELILSNHLQIIDVTNIDNIADVTYWNEDGNDKATITSRPDLFWRCTYRSDLCKTTKNPDILLSKPRTYCKCGTPRASKHVLLKCDDGQCDAWLHEYCIIDDVGTRAYEAYQQGKMDEFARDSEKSLISSLATRVVDTVRDVAGAVGQTVETVVEDGIAAVAAESLPHRTDGDIQDAPAEKGKSTKGKKSKARLWQAASEQEAEKSAWRKVFEIELLPPPYTSEVNTTSTHHPTYLSVQEIGGGQRRWKVRARCLVCECPT